jgi:hypothetical protein
MTAYLSESQADPLLELVGVVDSGIAGLQVVIAHILLRDGSKAIEILTRDRSVHAWPIRRARIQYSWLQLSRSTLSPQLPLVPSLNANVAFSVRCVVSSGFLLCQCASQIAPSKTGDCLSGEDVRRCMEDLAKQT